MTLVRKWLSRASGTSRFAESVLMLAGSTALSQLVVILASPILSRLYTPADFGNFAVYTSILSVLAVMVCGRYEQAIPLPEDDEEALNLLSVAMLVAAPVVTAASIIVLIWPGTIARWLGVPSLAPNLWLLPISLAGIATYQCLNYWASRRGAFKRIAGTKIVQQVAGQLLVSVPLGLAGAGSFGLLIGHSVTQITGARTLAKLLPKRQKRTGREVLGSATKAAIKYHKFPLVSMWAGLLSTLGWQIPTLFLTHFLSVEVVGHYSMAMRMMGLPATLIGGAVAQAFYPRAAQLRQGEELRQLTENTAEVLFAFSLPVFGTVAAVGPQLFAFAFGARWQVAGQYAQLLCPWFLVSIVSSPLSTLALVKERQSLSLVLTLYELSLRVACLWIGAVMLTSPEWSIALIGVAGAFICTISLFVMSRLVGCRFAKFAEAFARSLIRVAPVLCLLWVGSRFVGTTETVVLAVMAVSVQFYLSRHVLRKLWIL